ncbi:MAG: hypothetical protein VYA32_02760 [Planctomycetota bacterium]|nr:hypothetical protein [Planctomycetota bacterium]
MKTFQIAAVAFSLLIPIAGCTGPAPGESEAPSNVSETPGTDPFAAGKNGTDDEAVLEAPKIELPSGGGGR